jgi:hypothetical protein
MFAVITHLSFFLRYFFPLLLNLSLVDFKHTYAKLIVQYFTTPSQKDKLFCFLAKLEDVINTGKKGYQMDL